MAEMNEMMQELLTLITSTKTDEEIRQELEHYHDSDIADVIPFLNDDQRERLYHMLGDQQTSDILAYADHVEDYFEGLDQEKIADIIELMDADDAVDVLDTFDEDEKQAIVEKMDSEAAEDVRMISSYEDDEIGSKMTTNFIAITRDFTVKQAMKQVVKEAPENDNISTIYVLDTDGTFYGSIDLKDLIIARSDDPLSSIIRTSYPYLHDHDQIEEVINDLKDYALEMVPVVDDHDHLIGVITGSDIVEAVDEELGEDYAKLAGLTKEEDLDEPLHRSLRKRLPWLSLLLVMGLGVSLIISQFEAVIAVIPMIVFFQSVILDMAGNVGTQSLAVTIRSLMDEDLSGKMTRRMIFKEVRIGFLNGLTIGGLSFIAVFLFLVIRHLPITGEVFQTQDALFIALSVYSALVIALTLASFLGTTIPVLFKKLKVDPAVASGPLITTLNDIVSVVTYYGLAMLFFAQILH